MATEPTKHKSPLDRARDYIAQLPAESVISQKWGDSDTPVLSVLCCTFNHELYIAQSLHSMLIQETSFTFEILVHDDCSTDQTPHIIQLFAANFPQIVKPMYQNVNQYSRGGKPGRINRERARGRYYALCEGDDYWGDPRKLQRQVEFLESHGDYVLCGHDACVIDAAGHRIRDSKYPKSRRDFSGEDLIANRNVLMATNTYVYRAICEPYPPEASRVISGDRFLVSYLGQYGHCKYLEDIRPSYYRVHGGGVWSSIADADAKAEANMNTWYWLYRYYARIGKISEARRCWNRYLEALYRRSNYRDWLYLASIALWDRPSRIVGTRLEKWFGRAKGISGSD